MNYRDTIVSPVRGRTYTEIGDRSSLPVRAAVMTVRTLFSMEIDDINDLVRGQIYDKFTRAQKERS